MGTPTFKNIKSRDARNIYVKSKSRSSETTILFTFPFTTQSITPLLFYLLPSMGFAGDT